MLPIHAEQPALDTMKVLRRLVALSPFGIVIDDGARRQFDHHKRPVIAALIDGDHKLLVVEKCFRS